MRKREELERLEREDLEEEARVAGVARPEVLTREEILDAIEALEERASGDREGSKGFLGRVRLVLATFVEKGLNLPEAAERIRTGATAPAQDATPMATVTLAEIYAAQGHTERAFAVLDQILRAEPEHASALRLRAKLLGQPLQEPEDEEEDDDISPPPVLSEQPISELPTAVPATEPPTAVPATEPPTAVPVTEPPTAVPAQKSSKTELPLSVLAMPSIPPGPPRPAPILDEEPLPDHYEIDEIVPMSVDPTTLYLYWEIQPSLIKNARQTVLGGQLMLRIDQRIGERYRTLRLLHASPIGDIQVTGLPAGGEFIATLGLRSDFQWIALLRSEPHTLPPDSAVPEVARQIVHWREDKTIPMPPAEIPPALELAIAILPTPPTAVSSPEPVAPRESTPPPPLDVPHPVPLFSEEFGTLESHGTPLSPQPPPVQTSQQPLGSSDRWQHKLSSPLGSSGRLI